MFNKKGIIILILFIASVACAARFGNLVIGGNSITSLLTNQDIVLDPNGTGDVDVSSSKIINLVDPTDPQDAASKSYVDGAVPADTDDVPEGATNLYYTEARVSANSSVVANTAKVSFPEAPNDGTQYARKNLGWEAVAPVGATRALDNLLGVDINASLTPDTDNSLDLGTALKSWRIIYGRLFLSSDGTGEFGSDFNTPHQATFHSGHSNSATNTGNTTVQSGDQLAVGSGTVGDMFVKSGSVLDAGNANDSGDINIQIGTVAGAGARGKIKLIDGSEGSIGECWVSTGVGGEGNWDTCSSGGATIQLNNLSATAANIGINPGADNSIDLGTGLNSWRQIYNRIYTGNDTEVEYTSEFNGAIPVWLHSGHSNSANATATVRVQTGDQLAVGTGAVGDLFLESGSIFEATNTATTGDVVLQPGTTVGSGSRGEIRFNDASVGTAGECWVSTDTTGGGNWDTCPASGANDLLSNLSSPTAVNQTLNTLAIQPSLTNAYDLGASSLQYQDIYGIRLRVSETIWPDSSFGADIGSPGGGQFDDLYIQRVNYFNAAVENVLDINGEGGTTPSSAAVEVSFQGFSGTSTTDIGIYTNTTGSFPTGSMYIETGNAGGGTDNSGSINLITGTSAGGTRGATVVDSNLLDVKSGGAFTKVTADPCTDTTAFPEATLFYNDTSDYYCFCDGAGADVQMHSPATACF